MRMTEKIWRRLTAAARLPPGFLVIGAQKSGTTALFRHLLAHPLVLPPLTKEVDYFSFKHHRGSGWYRAHFPARRAGTWLTFEASPSYMLHPLAPSRAAAFDPRLKLIAILRDPVERALSQHAMMSRTGREPLGFEEAVEAEPERLSGFEEAIVTAPDNARSSARNHSYLRRGHYAKQIEAWLAHFPRENLLVLRTEDLRADGNRTMNRAFAFLGLPPHRLPVGEFTGQRRHTIDPALRERLRSHFAGDQARLEALLDYERARWPDCGTAGPDPAFNPPPAVDRHMPGSRPPSRHAVVRDPGRAVGAAPRRGVRRVGARRFLERGCGAGAGPRRAGRGRHSRPRCARAPPSPGAGRPAAAPP